MGVSGEDKTQSPSASHRLCINDKDGSLTSLWDGHLWETPKASDQVGSQAWRNQAPPDGMCHPCGLPSEPVQATHTTRVPPWGDVGPRQHVADLHASKVSKK